MYIAAPDISTIVWKEDASLPAVFHPLHSNMNQHLFEKNLCSQSSHNENYRQFPLRTEAIMCIPQSQHFSWYKDEWDTKEGIGKSVKNVLYEQQCPKRYLSDWSNIEQRNIQACIPMSEGIGQLVSQ